MEFPITRATLRALRQDAITARSIVNYICRMVEYTVINTKDYRYAYAIDPSITKSVIGKILDGLKYNFPDCGVVATKTYIFVDWY